MERGRLEEAERKRYPIASEKGKGENNDQMNISVLYLVPISIMPKY